MQLFLLSLKILLTTITQA